ncbi:hypothetical protein VA7868_04440 [Vibrio aerogenes CECT 7868]|uniref:Uncharacterized protein n=1 Tax=Vibrio aerogenes CECT 7868 TaxID=1216006 RepID=A0A1M6EEA2_9VIBR|nr:hypothetical protein [Vibrio aerogenes]SHI83751.1 hypothetical protein VA7868_04440 [Vibrio aerogenes CECT 7868]
MSDQTSLYNAFFKSQSRFLQQRCPEGYEADIVSDYAHWGKQLANYHDQDSFAENTLLCELFLKQVYLHMISAISDPDRSPVFRQACLDTIYIPLSGLQRFYIGFEHGMDKYFALKRILQSCQLP